MFSKIPSEVHSVVPSEVASGLPSEVLSGIFFFRDWSFLNTTNKYVSWSIFMSIHQDFLPELFPVFPSDFLGISPGIFSETLQE